jgi:hypothetical protein
VSRQDSADISRRGNIESARAILSAAIQRSDLDWPETVYEAYTQFENVHGTAQTLTDALARIDKESEKLNRRRQKQSRNYEAPAPVPEQPDVIMETVTASVAPAAEPASLEDDASSKR